MHRETDGPAVQRITGIIPCTERPTDLQCTGSLGSFHAQRDPRTCSTQDHWDHSMHRENDIPVVHRITGIIPCTERLTEVQRPQLLQYEVLQILRILMSCHNSSLPCSYREMKREVAWEVVLFGRKIAGLATHL